MVPDYTFPEIPILPEVEKLEPPYYKIDGSFFTQLDTYFTLIEGLQKEYEIDKEFYSKLGVVNVGKDNRE